MADHETGKMGNARRLIEDHSKEWQRIEGILQSVRTGGAIPGSWRRDPITGKYYRFEDIPRLATTAEEGERALRHLEQMERLSDDCIEGLAYGLFCVEHEDEATLRAESDETDRLNKVFAYLWSKADQEAYRQRAVTLHYYLESHPPRLGDDDPSHAKP